MKSLFKPSYHSGQLSEMSLFCGQTLTPPTAFAATFHWQPSCRPSQWQKPHVRIDAQERYVLGLHIGDEDARAVRRGIDALRRDAAGELDAGLGQNLRRVARVLVDAERLDLLRVRVRDEEHVALDHHLLRAAALYDLLRVRVVVQ